MMARNALEILLGRTTPRTVAPRPCSPRAAADAPLGGSVATIRNLLEEDDGLQHLDPASLGTRIQDYVFRHDQRQRYVDAATRYLKRDQDPTPADYDIVLVGAGLHAGAFLYTLRKARPDLRILVVERSEDICSTFARLGDALVLNSPTFSKVGLDANIVPGHFVQLSDFDELAERPFPTAKHLQQLATMVLFHADANIRFSFEVDDITSSGTGYRVSTCDGYVHARCVIVCNGMGSPRDASFAVDRRGDDIMFGDDFLSTCQNDRSFARSLCHKRVAVVGAGDTANCVMERLLPLVYPNDEYGLNRAPLPLPKSVVWIGQGARHIREYFFANKTRYCHAGGLIELFWDGDSPFELPYDTWRRTKERLRSVPDRLVSVVHQRGVSTLTTESETVDVDLVIDCTGRFNVLASRLQRRAYHFVEGDVEFHGGRWDDEIERFTAAPRTLKRKRIACQLTGEHIYLLGCATPLGALIDDEEARDGSLTHVEERTSLTNSKWSF
ncbi:MAG: hypothetical protein AAF211_12210, partial [Myxococcota bacterium]